MTMINNAFDIVYYALSGMLVHFLRLFAVFDMGSFLYPILLISVVYAFIISPFIHRVHDGAMDGVYLRSKIGFRQQGENRNQRKTNKRNYDAYEAARIRDEWRSKRK